MIIAASDSKEMEFREIINHVAEICQSEEFISLRDELERVYRNNGIDNSLLIAFQDALYSMLAQQEGVRCPRSMAK
jgi:hypothetical protein